MSDKIQILYARNAENKDLQSGLMSSISWQRMKPLLEKEFGITGNEVLVGITVTKDGIKGKIDIIKDKL